MSFSKQQLCHYGCITSSYSLYSVQQNHNSIVYCIRMLFLNNKNHNVLLYVFPCKLLIKLFYVPSIKNLLCLFAFILILSFRMGIIVYSFTCIIEASKQQALLLQCQCRFTVAFFQRVAENKGHHILHIIISLLDGEVVKSKMNHYPGLSWPPACSR